MSKLPVDSGRRHYTKVYFARRIWHGILPPGDLMFSVHQSPQFDVSVLGTSCHLAAFNLYSVSCHAFLLLLANSDALWWEQDKESDGAVVERVFGQYYQKYFNVGRDHNFTWQGSARAMPVVNRPGFTERFAQLNDQFIDARHQLLEALPRDASDAREMVSHCRMGISYGLVAGPYMQDYLTAEQFMDPQTPWVRPKPGAAYVPASTE